MRFVMRQKLISFGDDFYIEDGNGRKKYFVDGKALSIAERLSFKDMEGNELAYIKEKLISIRDSYVIYRNGELAATVKKALIAPLRDRYTIDVRGGEDMTARGDILDFEYGITREGRTVAEISKKLLSLRDTYTVDVADDEDPVLVLAITVAVDMMAHDKDEK